MRPVSRVHPRTGPFLLLILCSLLAPGCARRDAQAEDVSIEWNVTPTRPAVGDQTTATLKLRDHSGRSVSGAKLRIEGHMSHPGMAPFLVTPEEKGDGLYEARFEFTMGGDWILLVTGELPDQRRVNHRIDVVKVHVPR